MKSHLAALAALIAAAAVLVPGAGAASSGMPQQSGSVDLLTQADVEIRASQHGGEAGRSVAGVGDMNGDGRGDVVVGVPRATVGDLQAAGQAYVLFGGENRGPTTLFAVDAGMEPGIRIDGANALDGAGRSVAGAGDVNGDGRPDVVIGALTSNNDRKDAGGAYVVFGTASSTTIDLAALGTRGFRIDGATEGDFAGNEVAGVGDVNGDGLSDVAVGAEYADNGGGSSSGSAYVVFGSASTQTVDLASLGARGFRIDGAAQWDLLGDAIAGAGDVDGDGRADVLVGAPSADPEGRYGAGAAYLVLGSASTATVDVSALGARGVRIVGASSWDLAGDAVAGIGDVDGDGTPDIAVGAPSASPDDRIGAGSAYVVFGEALASEVDLAALGENGFRIDGASSFDGTGRSLAGAGDVNGDGRPDIVVGAPAALGEARRNAGSAFVVYGTGSTDTIDLGALAGRGVRIHGAAVYDSTGDAVAGAGDVNGDGRRDVLVGAPYRAALGFATGGAYVVYGWGRAELGYDALVGAAGEPVAAHRPRHLRRTGSVGFVVEPALPQGLHLDPSSGIVSGTPRISVAGTTFTVTMTDLTGSVSAPLSITLGPDRTPPAVVMAARSPQTVLRQRGIEFVVSCDEPCRLTASARIAGGRSAIRFGPRVRVIRATTAIKLRLGTKAWAKLAALVESGARVQATVTVRAADLAGNVSVERRTIRVR